MPKKDNYAYKCLVKSRIKILIQTFHQKTIKLIIFKVLSSTSFRPLEIKKIEQSPGKIK